MRVQTESRVLPASAAGVLTVVAEGAYCFDSFKFVLTNKSPQTIVASAKRGNWWDGALKV